MTFPFHELNEALRQQGMVVATLIGIAFGFVLERAGFGRADKLAAQFYLRDMRVFKVMFSAIVTAMCGLMIASGIGLTDLRAISESIASFTWIWPMLAGGFVLGIGFIVSGYCPGTSVVAMGSGNIDGLVTVAGVVTGTFAYTRLLRVPAVAGFHESGAKGPWFLYDVFGIAPEVLAGGITAVAVLAFVGAEKVEAWVRGEVKPERPARRRFAFATLALLALAAVMTLAVPRPVAATVQTPSIAASELARLVVDEPWRVRIFDVREPRAFAAARIPGSENVAPSALADVVDDGRTIVVVGEAKAAPAGAVLLAGGIDAWNREPLAQALMRGTPPPPPPPAVRGVIAKPKKKGGGCSS